MRTAAVVVLLVVGGGAIAGCGGGGPVEGSSAPASAREETYLWDCQKAVRRPATVPLGCGTSRIAISHVRFSAWDGASARALGRWSIPECDPSCADGAINEYPAQLDFARVVRCDDGKRYFSRVSLTYTGESPTDSAMETEDITPVGLACEPV